MTSLSLETDVPEKKIVNDLVGGLSIVPYGLLLLFCAYAFSQRWLDWGTNGGIPFLGCVIAWLLDTLIRWIYRKKYVFSFSRDTSKKNRKLASPIQFLTFLVFLTFLLASWYLDYKTQLPIRFLPILIGLPVGYRGIDWIRKGDSLYGQLLILFGVLLLAFGVAPWILHLPSHEMYFGPEGIYEFLLEGSLIALIGIMEHIIFLRARNAGTN
jgi:hypothetical protein